jgi:hypothetical protein
MRALVNDNTGVKALFRLVKALLRLSTEPQGSVKALNRASYICVLYLVNDNAHGSVVA